MKISCVLILFVVVNILADDKKEYILTVAITNIHIKKASEVNDDSLGNGLVKVINNIVTQRVPMEEMYLMFAAPDKPNLKDLKESIHTMELLQRNIPDEMLGPVPSKQKFKRLNLSKPGEARRRLTGNALKKLIAHKLDEYEPLSRDTEFNFDTMTRPLKNMPLCDAFVKMARLNIEICICLGLWTSTKTSSLTSAHTQGNGDCFLNGDGGDIKYRIFENKYWQVEADDIGKRIKELRVQLEE